MTIKDSKIFFAFVMILTGLFFFSTAKAGGPPDWYDLNAHIKLVESKSKSETPGTKLELQKFQIQKIKLGSHRLRW